VSSTPTSTRPPSTRGDLERRGGLDRDAAAGALAQRVHVRALDLAVEFDGGEDLLTEISAKFTADGLSAELEAADFVLDGVWVAGDGEFLLTVAHPYC